MTSPVVIPIPTFFYPIGNTPAVCLVQDMPRGRNTSLLLLGCGDARNILYTTYMETPYFPRQLDFTCCDIEPAILARNILLFSLIIDDAAGLEKEVIWKIYYELYLDDTSLGRLEKQARKLHELSSSMDKWHTGPYGRLLRICDSTTLALLRKAWSRCVPDDSKHYSRVADRLKKACEFRKEKIGDGVVTTSLRSCAPLVEAGARDLARTQGRFWDKDSVDLNPNPSLGSALSDTSALHYGTDSILGFHLSAAYAPFCQNSPHAPSTKSNDPLQRLKQTAQLQFHAWCEAFRCSQKKLTLRSCTSDAFTLCYTLQHLNITGEICANWPHHAYQPEILTLDNPDYLHPDTAPRSFNVIDTSNLIDAFGALNVLSATAPLLEEHVSSTLYTELLAGRAENFKEALDDLLGGHFPTMAVLLGLFPVGYWTNASAVSDADEPILHEMSKNGIGGQMFHRQGWKLQLKDTQGAGPRRLHFDEADLRGILLDCYRKLFCHENLGSWMSQLMAKRSQSYRTISLLPRYHRANFAALLKYVKNRVHVPDWQNMMRSLVADLGDQSQLLVGANYLQELCVYLHLYDVYSIDEYRGGWLQVDSSQRYVDFRAWKVLPTVISVTVRVPRAKLSVFTEPGAKDVATPIVNGFVESSQGTWQNLFCSVQMCFGSLKVSSSPANDDYSVSITQDATGWSGKSDLFVSFWVPTWMLLQEPRQALVGLSLQTGSASSIRFAKQLGYHLKVHGAQIGLQDDVFVTKQRPNQGKHPILCGVPLARSSNSGGPNEDGDFSTFFKADVDREKGKISGFTAHVDFCTEKMKSILTNKEMLLVRQEGPCSISLLVGNTPSCHSIELPAPVFGNKHKLRVARKSSFVEIVIPMADGPESQFPGFMFPIYLDSGKPIVWNMPTVNADRLPMLDRRQSSKLQWLSLHASFMFSAREKNLRESGSALTKDARVNFKESLFSMYMQFTGVQGKHEVQVFGLNDPENEGVEILELANIGIVQITVDKEKNVWKQAIPAFVERCRKWRHRFGCEYRAKSRVPLSFELGEPLLCSCGNGVLPDNFITNMPGWNIAAKYAVRAAISPLFPSPLVEKLVSAESLDRRSSAATSPANGVKEVRYRNCGKGKNADGGGLHSCSRCRLVMYCSKECQKADWKKHKAGCQKT